MVEKKKIEFPIICGKEKIKRYKDFFEDDEYGISKALRAFRSGIGNFINQANCRFKSQDHKDRFQERCDMKFLEARAKDENFLVPLDKDNRPIENFFSYGFEVGKSQWNNPDIEDDYGIERTIGVAFSLPKDLEDLNYGKLTEGDYDIPQHEKDELFHQMTKPISQQPDSKECDEKIEFTKKEFDEHMKRLSSAPLNHRPIIHQEMAMMGEQKTVFDCDPWFRSHTGMKLNKRTKKLGIDNSYIFLRIMKEFIGDYYFSIMMHFMSFFGGVNVRFPSLEEVAQSVRDRKIYEEYISIQERKVDFQITVKDEKGNSIIGFDKKAMKASGIPFTKIKFAEHLGFKSRSEYEKICAILDEQEKMEEERKTLPNQTLLDPKAQKAFKFLLLKLSRVINNFMEYSYHYETDLGELERTEALQKKQQEEIKIEKAKKQTLLEADFKTKELKRKDLQKEYAPRAEKLFQEKMAIAEKSALRKEKREKKKEKS